MKATEMTGDWFLKVIQLLMINFGITSSVILNETQWGS